MWICAGRRFLEMFIINVFLSALIFGMYKMNVIPSTMAGCFLSLGFGAIVFWVVNIIQLRRCRFALPDRKTYLTANYIAFGAFVLFSLIFLVLVDSETYTWLFAITKFLKYSNMQLGASFMFGDEAMTETFFASMIFHAITAFVIWAAPVGMEEMLSDAKKENWQDRIYTMVDIMDAVERTREKYGNNDDLFLDELKLIFDGASDNEIRRLLGMELLPEEDDDDELESILDENGFLDESKLVYYD